MQLISKCHGKILEDMYKTLQAIWSDFLKNASGNGEVAQWKSTYLEGVRHWVPFSIPWKKECFQKLANTSSKM
jgi:hypothetical protein